MGGYIYVDCRKKIDSEFWRKTIQQTLPQTYLKI